MVGFSDWVQRRTLGMKPANTWVIGFTFQNQQTLGMRSGHIVIIKKLSSKHGDIMWTYEIVNPFNGDITTHRVFQPATI
jgi:hypothetical protein